MRAYVLVVIGLLLCGCPKKSKPDPVDPTFEITEVVVPVQVPFDGCLSADVTVLTDEGVELRLASGTCLWTPWGERLTGGVKLRVGPAADVGELETMANRTFHGHVEVSATLDSPAGDIPVEVLFDPPAVLDMDTVLAGYNGQWTFSAFAADLSSYALPAAVAPRPPGEPPADKAWTATGVSNIDGTAESGTTVFIPVSSVTGADLTDPGIPADGETVEGDVIHEQELGDSGSEWPKVGTVTIINADTAIITSLSQWVPGLYLPGQRRIVDGQGAEDAFEIRIVEKNGKRVLEIVSPYRNKFRIRVCLRYEDGSVDYQSADSVGYSEGEDDTDGPYLGRIYIYVRGCFSFDEYDSDIADIIKTGAADPKLVFADWGRFSEPQGVRVKATSGLVSESAKDYAQRIADNAPPDWEILVGNRLIIIDIPCPPSQVALTDFGGALLHELDPTDYSIANTTNLPFQPSDFLVSRSGVAVIAGTDQIEMIDLVADQQITNIPVPGLISAIAPGPFGQTFFVATTQGEFLSIRFDDATVLWSAPIPQGHDYTTISVPDDGTFAYVASPTLDEVVEIDLLRRMPGPPIPVPNTYAASVSHDGRTLAVVDNVGGAVTLFELGTQIPAIGVPTGQGAAFSFWPTADDGVIVSNTQAGTVSLVDRTDGSVVQVPTANGATSITESHNGAGAYDILVGNFADNSLSVFPYSDISAMPTVTTTNGYNQANALHEWGR